MNVRLTQSESGIRRSHVRQLFAIARTTVTESVQQPIALLILIAAVVTTLLVPVFQFHRFSEDGRLARDSGLSCMLVFGLALAIGTAGQAVASEISRGTAAAALGKPVSRLTFLLAKWLGVLMVVTLFWGGVLAATLVAERCSAHFIIQGEYAGYATDPVTLSLALGGVGVALIVAAIRHYFWRKRFGRAAFLNILIAQISVVLLSGFYNRLGQLYPLQGEAACGADGCDHAHEAVTNLFYHIELNLGVIPVALLVLFALALFTALATALATRFSTGAVLAFCATILFFGLAGDTLKGSAPLLSMRGLLPGFLPDIQNFWLCDAIARGGQLSWKYVAEAGIHAVTFCVLFLTLGYAAFRQRDLG